ncbi:RHS repeat-associated core domain-containing protein [Pseudomonas syringae]|uniref:RHS repeat-associated core domain-containing protein n=1 Tax=Pseudomonas syringae TaxID=317 RepID=UPI0039FD7394
MCLLEFYRAYKPLLMRFNGPESLSPLGKGGLNAYAYCVGDPVNRTDPTGYESWDIFMQAWP